MMWLKVVILTAVFTTAFSHSFQMLAEEEFIEGDSQYDFFDMLTSCLDCCYYC